MRLVIKNKRLVIKPLVIKNKRHVIKNKRLVIKNKRLRQGRGRGDSRGGARGRADLQPPDRYGEEGRAVSGQYGEEGRAVSGQYGRRDETCPVSTGGSGPSAAWARPLSGRSFRHCFSASTASFPRPSSCARAARPAWVRGGILESLWRY